MTEVTDADRRTMHMLGNVLYENTVDIDDSEYNAFSAGYPRANATH